MNDVYPILALIAVNIIWGIATPVFKITLQEMPPFTLAFVRFFFATLFFLPFLGKQVSFGSIEGNVYFVLSTLFSIVGTLLIKHTVKAVSPLTILFISFLFAAFVFFPLMMMEMSSWSFDMLSLKGWLALGYGLIFSSVIGYLIYYYVVPRTSMQAVGIYGYLAFIVSVVAGIFLLQEYPSLYFYLGSLLILLGLFIAEQKPHFYFHPFHKIEQFFKRDDPPIRVPLA